MKRAFFIFLLLHCLQQSFSQKIELGVNTGQSEEIWQEIISPNGHLFVTIGIHGTINIWETATGKLLKSFVHKQGVYSAFFNPDGKTLLIIEAYANAVILDINTGKELFLLEVDSPSFVQKAGFSPDGKFIYLITTGKNASIWNSENGQLSFTVQQKDGFITAAEFAGDSKTIFLSATDSTLYSYDLDSKKATFHTKYLDGIIKDLSISSDGKYLALSNSNKSILLWSIEKKQIIQEFVGSKGWPRVVEFFNNDKNLVSIAKDSLIRFWDVSSGKIIKELFVPDVYSIKLSNARNILVSHGDDYVRVHDLSNYQVIDSISFHPVSEVEFIFSPNDQTIYLNPIKKNIISWDYKHKKSTNIIEESKINIVKAKFAYEQKNIVLIDNSLTFTLWDFLNGHTVNSKPIVNGSEIYTLYCSKTQFHNNQFIVPNENEVITIDVETMQPVRQYKKHRAYISSAEYSQDGNKIISSSGDSTAIIWDTKSTNALFVLRNHHNIVTYAGFNMDGTRAITVGFDHNAIIWNSLNGKELFRCIGHKDNVNYAAFNHSGSLIATESSDGILKVWNGANGKEIYSYSYKINTDNHLKFTSDEKYLMFQTAYNVMSIYDAFSGTFLYSLSTHNGLIIDANFSDDNKYIITNSNDKTCKLWEAETGAELLTFMNLSDNDWLVLHASGLFDASSGAMDKLYWVQDLNVIDFSQLKERYYEPGLWNKIITGAALRSVKGLNEAIPLYPEIKLSEIDNNGNLKIKLKNQGGGIGKVTVFINGKEIADDIRDKQFNSNVDTASILVKIINHPYLINGDTNIIEVKAFNGENWVVSRSESIQYIDKNPQLEAGPSLYLVSIGVSDYSGDNIDLKFPSKDAEDIYTAVNIGGNRLFGTTKTHSYLINSNSEKKPNKENIKGIFEEISKKANSKDVIVIYLSGHGINWGGDDGDFYFLTEDAWSASAEAYNDEAIRTKSGISSKELTEWIKSIPALKQVLIIDACASGRIVEDLVAQRHIPSNTIRSLDRMKNRTGLHIITGCAADAASYEASRYGQGVLTYSLLEGMKGVSLREGRFVDIIQWFQYARERVPVLANGIGGIQEPQIISPNGSESFDVGQLEEEDKKIIPLSAIKPMYIRSNFQDEDELDDVLDLGNKMDEALIEYSSKGNESTIAFADVKKFPDAYKLIGRYKKELGSITLTLKVKQGTEIITSLTIKGIDVDDIIQQLLKKINDF